MESRLEITLKEDLLDAEGLKLQKNAKKYFGIELESVRTVHILTFDSSLTKEELEIVRVNAFTNPVIQISSFDPLDIDFDYCLWIGFRPGVKDNAGSTAIEAIEDILSIDVPENDGVYTSKRYCIKSKDLTVEQADILSSELLANDIIQQWKIFKRCDWDTNQGVGIILPKVDLNHKPTVQTVTVESDQALLSISDERNLALNPNDIPTIREYFLKKNIRKDREEVGLSDPTDLELEYISQARSDHCNHNTFQGIFRYKDMESGDVTIEDNPFKKYIKDPTLKLKDMKDWVVSVLWDNAGVGKFDEEFNYTITGETHNSPSNMEAYGGAITGIVGVFRDPLGTGLGSKLIMGSYGFCVGDFDYDGELKPKLHPRRLLDGVIEGVKDGGNKSGVPTTFGQVMFNNGYLGKSLVFVTALGLMPAKIKDKMTHEKTTTSGDLIIMSGGRVGKDGIHGVTASSEVFSENTPAGHVQIGDPYTQKKMHDFILEVRDESLMTFITDNGGGGLSSSIGESAELSNGCIVDLEKVPLKYEGLDQWEIWISESQERMTIAVKPENIDRFMELSKKHAVESTIIGEYTNSGKLHIKYNGKTCAFVNIDFLASSFPQWEFEAEWISPELRGLKEPVINPPKDYNELIKDIISRPNICSKEWVTRQYDHEVQGTSVIKPLVGKGRDVNSDASVIRPVLTSEKGLAFTQSLLPMYSKIDAYHMTTCTIDESVRRMISVGTDFDHISGVDNFCWPDIGYDENKNPDGKFKAAQLIRSCRALKYMCEAYEMPLLSGKDSMYVDGHLKGPYGETRKVSALETMQFSTTGLVNDIAKCVTMDLKSPGDSVYILGETKNELGASEYYERFGYTGVNVPVVEAEKNAVIYKALSSAIDKGLIASSHGIYRGGLGVHLSMVAMGGKLGMDLDLSKVPMSEKIEREDTILFSESAGRFIVTVTEDKKEVFEKIFKGLACECIGSVTENETLNIKGFDKEIVSLNVNELLSAWKAPFGEMI
jgi:phosphoribosylformylglycinamidine synthase